ncbi:MAG TPA: hypothetical protein VKP58_07425 [Candidatus Acidoferrum sp.]|nr:hypothetical protein [Candidatus Acidoferrum sp.]
MKIGRHFKLITKLGVSVLALGALATGANAQNSYAGKFTLPFETHWGDSTLPAGDYTFTLESNSSPYVLYIQGQKASVIVRATSAEAKVVSGHAQLNLVDIGDVHAVQTFEAPGLRETFTYWTPAQSHAGRKEARQKTMTPAAPATQASENITTIEVHPTSR